MVRKIIQWVPLTELDGETSLSMITKIHGVGVHYGHCSGWCHGAPSRVTNTARLGGFVGGALVGVLALLFIKREMETHYDIENSPDLGLRLLEIVCSFFADREAVRLLESGSNGSHPVGSTDPVVRFQWTVHGVSHLAMQLQ